ncbi:carboxypeptidase-like regulatory domain-containing protein [Candidatus Palauibacter sp.]|uniref:carboxypeptidase-like regulatory domain-containing protein n=1 Tax=Candidatus Palauibacter sp. TaxID=3101350 RepID=UPI003B015774
MTHRFAAARKAFAWILGVTLPALPLAAQEASPRLSGIVLTEGDGGPVEGAHITLVDLGNVVLAEALTDLRGGFHLTAPQHGVYRVRVTRIGYESWVSDTLHIAAPPESRALQLDVPVRPIPLPELSVTEQNVCPTTAAERWRAFELYELVLPVLSSVSTTADIGVLRMRLVRPIILWRRGGRRFAYDTVTVVTNKALNNASPEHLAANGYAEVVNDSITTFYAPDGRRLGVSGLPGDALSAVGRERGREKRGAGI